jgi:hypothetical protein
MPSGMLAPTAPRAAVIGPSSFVLAHAEGARPTGEWIELKASAEARAVYLPALVMPLLHEAFARALPGFGPFGVHRFEGNALGQLRDEIDTIAKSAGGISLTEARRRWPSSDALARIAGENEWEPCRAAFARALAELTAFLDAARRRQDVITVTPSP